MPESEFRPEPQRAGCGAIALLVVGLLILVPSGLCTGFMTIYPIMMALSSRTPNGDIGNFVGLALTVGAPFVLVGGFLTWSGIKRLRR
jgi:hypothetical protein